MPDIYLKAATLPASSVRTKIRLPLPRTRRSKKILSLVLFAFGFFAISNAAIPILNYEFRYSRRFVRLISPLSVDHYNKKALINISANASDQASKDYTLISSWFDEKPLEAQKNFGNNTTTFYTISIPRLKIDHATVEVGGEDLKKSLVQYPETAPPGQLGNAVIFGHSVMPQFFNPRDYVSIFSTLYRLEPGDEILVHYDTVTYRYLVEDLFEVQPTDLSVLQQRYDKRQLTLITCAPAGTYLRRLIIRTSLSP